jgi:hypothetical protein
MACRICSGAGVSRCPIHSTSLLPRMRREINKGGFFGDSPPSVFVGHYNYPHVRAGVLAPPVEGTDLDNPAKWFAARLGIPQVVEKRLSLLNLSFSAKIQRPASAREYFSELARAVTPTEVEAKTERLLRGQVSFDSYNTPMGPSAPLLGLKITSNPKIPSKVDSILSEKISATEGVTALFDDGFDVYYLQRLLSAGLLGKSGKKLVPTRWSITAADSIVSESLVEKIREFPPVETVQVFFSSHLDNEFHVILVPHAWAFEQIEAYVPSGTLVTDNEFHAGRKTYAKNVAGGYYAGRLSVCEYLLEKKRQAAVLILRSVGPAYYAPLGVWQVRENVRNAMAGKPAEFANLESALGHVFSSSRLERNSVLGQSKLLAFLRKQSKLGSF